MILDSELEYFFIDHFWYGVFALLFSVYILLMAKLYNIGLVIWIAMGMISVAAAFIGIGILIVTDETRD